MIQNLCLNPSIIKFCDIIHLEILSFIYEWFHKIRPSCFADSFKPLSSVHSLRSRRLEVVGTRKNRRVRTRPRVSPRAPVLSFAHYFQAPATQAILSLVSLHFDRLT